MARRAISGKDLLLYRGNDDVGSISGVTITNGGTGYSNSFAVTFTGGGGTGATGTATASGGVIQSVTMTNEGSGYTSAPTPVFTAGSGSSGAGTATRRTTETYDVIVCLTSNNLTQTSNVITADSKCGTLKLPGTKDRSVAFDFISIIDPDSNEVSFEQLQTDYESQEERNWRITTAAQASGDPIFDFSAYLSEYNLNMGLEHFGGSGTLQVDENGVTLTSV